MENIPRLRCVVTAVDIISDQTTHKQSLREMQMVRRIVLGILRKNIAAILDEKDIGQERAIQSGEKLLRSIYYCGVPRFRRSLWHRVP